MNKQKTLIEKLEQMQKAIDKGFRGLITEVTETTNTEFFKDKGTYDEREGLNITVKLNSPDGETFSQFFAEPKMLGLKQSNIGKFVERYGTPKKGLEIDVVINDDGFFRIVI